MEDGFGSDTFFIKLRIERKRLRSVASKDESEKPKIERASLT
jgi:hypothetical protein